MAHRVAGDMEINVSQEVLAQMTAATVNRLIGKWEQQGLVNVRWETLVIATSRNFSFFARRAPVLMRRVASAVDFSSLCSES